MEYHFFAMADGKAFVVNILIFLDDIHNLLNSVTYVMPWLWQME